MLCVPPLVSSKRTKKRRLTDLFFLGSIYSMYCFFIAQGPHMNVWEKLEKNEMLNLERIYMNMILILLSKCLCEHGFNQHDIDKADTRFQRQTRDKDSSWSTCCDVSFECCFLYEDKERIIKKESLQMVDIHIKNLHVIQNPNWILILN